MLSMDWLLSKNINLVYFPIDNKQTRSMSNTCKLPHLQITDKRNKDNLYHMYVVLSLIFKMESIAPHM